MTLTAFYRTGLTAAIAAIALAAGIQPAAAAGPTTHSRIALHFDLASGQRPENALLEPDGDLVVSMSQAAEVVRITPRGTLSVIARLPHPADGGRNVPVLGFALSEGLARADDGSIYVGYEAGDQELNGIWRVKPGGRPQRIIALPADTFPNGMALDRHTGQLYFADAIRGVVWRAPASGGRATVWADGPELKVTGRFGLGANGLKLHNGAVWVTNFDQGLLLRIPMTRAGSAGPIQTRAELGGGGPDDFVFVDDHHDDTIVALDPGNQVQFVRSDGTTSTILSAHDGLQGPTSIVLRGNRMYIFSAAFITVTDPNMLVADLP